MQTTIITLYLLTLAILAIYGVHRTALLRLFLKHRHDAAQPRARYAEDALPTVTVQLPMFNELVVAERLIESVARLDYPADKLQIQVLDDSTDATRMVAAQKVRALQDRGVWIEYLHRTDRTGYKAGALQAGMESAAGEFLMIFDADFVPRPDTLRRLIDHFTDESIGMVQARWSHLNRRTSSFTQAQAMLLDGHFVVEHTARNRSGRFFNFNGTAGIWRKSAIVDAGGWQHDTVTEDMDLSYRAQLAGWRFVYVPEVDVPAELPPDINAFKTQQYRWAKGSVQTARKLLGRIMRTPDVSLKAKTEAFFHLTNNFAYMLLVLLAVLQLPNMLIRRKMEAFTWLLALDVPLFLATCGSICAFYLVTHRHLYGTVRGAVRRLPTMMALGIGLSLNNGRAVFDGLFGDDLEFVRTPKRGGDEVSSGKTAYLSKASLLCFVELGLAGYFFFTMWVAVVEGCWWSIPFLSLFLCGFAYVGGLSVCQAIQARLQRPSYSAHIPTAN